MAILYTVNVTFASLDPHLVNEKVRTIAEELGVTADMTCVEVEEGMYCIDSDTIDDHEVAQKLHTQINELIESLGGEIHG